MLEKISLALKIDVPELFSMKLIPLCTAKIEIEEQVWLSIGKTIENYISKSLYDLKKEKTAK